jgi:hypothetical protein
MYSMVESVWGLLLTVGIVPATAVAYWDFAEHVRRMAHEVEEVEHSKRLAAPTGVKYRHEPLKSHKVAAHTPLV